MASSQRLKKAPRNEPDIPTGEHPKYICIRCGKAFTKADGNFPVSHTHMYRQIGRLPWCNDCVDAMYTEYFNRYENKRKAVRRMCMKFDLYYSDAMFDMAEKLAGDRSIIRAYLSKININRFLDYSFDNTLSDEMKADEDAKEEAARILRERKELENRQAQLDSESAMIDKHLENVDAEAEALSQVPDDIKRFWGPGYEASMYWELEDRLNFWKSQYPEGYKFDVGELALLRQICGLEIDSNHDRAAGRPSDKSANMLNTLIGSLKLKPVQKKDEVDAEIDGTPLGVYIQMWEQRKPLPEIDEKYKDINGNIKNIYTWFYGAASKMVGLKNAYCRMFEDALEKWRVQRPDIDQVDDDSAIDEYFSSHGGDD